MTKSSAGGAANNIGPDYIDGVMFANDYEWWTYGGLVTSTASYSAPAANSVALYELYTTAPGTLFNQGFILSDLPGNITRYVSYGAGVSVPSENLGFYFGGARSSSGGEIFYVPANESVNADQIASSLIELNITLIPQGGGQWNNHTLPPTVTSRVSGELVWVPVGQNGALIAVGGVTEIVWETLNTSISAADAATIVRSSLSLARSSSYAHKIAGSRESSIYGDCCSLRHCHEGLVSAKDHRPVSNWPCARMHCGSLRSRRFQSQHLLVWWLRWDSPV